MAESQSVSSLRGRTHALLGADAYSFWDRNKTFKPERQLPAGSKASNLQHTMQATMKATLGGGELQNTVKLPEGEDVSGKDTSNDKKRG